MSDQKLFDTFPDKQDVSAASATDALRLLGQAVDHYDIAHCMPCYDALSQILHSIDQSADLEPDYLAIWSDFVADQKIATHCEQCVMPKWQLTAMSRAKKERDRRWLFP